MNLPGILMRTPEQASDLICPHINAECLNVRCMHWTWQKQPLHPRLYVNCPDSHASKEPNNKPDGVGKDWKFSRYYERDDGAYTVANWWEDDESYLKRCGTGSLGYCALARG